MPRPVARRLSRRVIYDGKMIRLERDVVRLPHGPTAVMEIVRHRGSVVLIPQPAPDRIILIRQYRYVAGRSIWELPAGSIDAGEGFIGAARRECEEEIGLRPGRLTRLGAFYATPGFCDERMVFYLCEDLALPPRPARGDDDEHIRPKAMTLGEAWRLVDRRQVVDMKTVIGLALVERHRRRRAARR